MEPHVTLVYLDEHERVNIWTASQSPSYVRTEVSATFGIPMNRIRVRVPYLGGGYGAKLYAKLEPLVTLLALITRKPVRYALTREEEFLTVTKHGVVTKIKTALKNGAITARKCEVYWDTGAYAEIGPRIGHKSGYTSAGPYRIPKRLDRFVLCVHEQCSRRRLSRFWCAAGYMGVRFADRHDRARHRCRPGGVSSPADA